MLSKALALSGFSLLPLLTLPPVLATDLPPANQWIPQEAAVVVEVAKPLALLDPLLSPAVATAVTNLSTGQKPNLKLQQLQGMVAYLELQLGTDWRTALRQLAGSNLTLSLGPGGAALLSVDGRDAKLLNQLHDIVRNFAVGEATRQNHPDRVSSREYRSVTTWTLGTNEAHAIIENRLLLANRPQILDRALDLRAASQGKCIATVPAYQAARQAAGKNAVAFVFLNLQMLRELPGVKKALADDANPVGVLLLADTKEALRNANWLALGAFVEGDTLELRTFTDGKAPEASKAASFTVPRGPDEGVLPNLTVPGTIASLSLYRDLQRFYAAKDALFAERTSGLVFFENMMGIFFSGIELTDGVLGELRPDLRIVVAAQKYDPAIGTPEVQVPAFAAVLRLRHPQTFGDVVEEAWQKAIGLANFTRGQKALPGLVVDRDSHAGIKYTLAAYRPPADKDKPLVDARYNYRPSLARLGDYLVISSTDGLAKDLIDTLKPESAGPVKCSQAAHTLARVDGPHLRTILLANRERLVRNNMVEKGNTREKAENDIAILLTALDCLNEATFTLSREHSHPQAQLNLKLKAPDTSAH